MTQDRDIDDLLRDLGEALMEAVSDSDTVADRLHQIQEAGYSLILRVDCKQGGSESSDQTNSLPGPGETPGRPQPTFRINSSDLSFLRSIGIDPTRKSRSRRSR